MRLDYGTQLSPVPITLSIGTLRKPTLKEISQITFDRFSFYEFFLKLSPETYYTKLRKENDGEAFWDSLTEEERDKITIYNIIEEDDKIRSTYVEIFNFFFVETVIYQEGFFILLKDEVANPEKIKREQVRGAIAKDNFSKVMSLLQQICCVYNEEESLDDMKFKNNLARKLMEMMLKAKKKEQETKKSDLNLTIPNIISSLANKHPSLNYVNIWDLTIFQLLDAFNRTQANSMYDIDSTRVSVWGDEKKTFDVSLWYKNNYDKK